MNEHTDNGGELPRIDVRIGSRIDEYRILAEIGAGGMGVVFRARDERLERDVALKFLSRLAVHDRDKQARFLREARSLSALQHPNVCAIHRAGELEDGQLYLCMSYVEGESLARILTRGRLPWLRAVALAIEACRGLEAIHEIGIVHRDIKPGNLIVGPSGHLTVVDFGLAKRPGFEDLTSTGSSFGTLAYMAPEQLNGDDVDERADLWSLGITLYESVSGGRPFPGPTLPTMIRQVTTEPHRRLDSVRPGVPAELAHVVDRLLEKEPDARIRSAAEVRKCLEAIVESRRETDSLPTELVVRRGEQRRGSLRSRPGLRRRALAVGGALLALVVVLSVVVLQRRGGDGGPTPEQTRARELLETALREEEAGLRLQDRLPILEQAVRLDPDLQEGRLALAFALVDLWEVERDEAALTRAEGLAASIGGDVPEIRLATLRAQIARCRGDVERCIEILKVPVAAHPREMEALDELVACRLLTDRAGEAEAHLRSLTARTGDLPEIWLLLGQLLERRGELVEAEEAYRWALDRAGPSQRTGVVERLAHLQLIRGDYRAALDTYALLEGPIRKARIASNVSTAHFYLGEIEAAIRTARTAVELQPLSPMFHANLGDCLAAVGRSDDARSEYLRASELQQERVDAGPGPGDLLVLGLYLAQAGACADSGEALDRESASPSPSIFHVRARALALCDRRSDAMEALRRAVDAGLPRARLEEPEFVDLRKEPGFHELLLAAVE